MRTEQFPQALVLIDHLKQLHTFHKFHDPECTTRFCNLFPMTHPRAWGITVQAKCCRRRSWEKPPLTSLILPGEPYCRDTCTLVTPIPWPDFPAFPWTCLIPVDLSGWPWSLSPDLLFYPCSGSMGLHPSSVRSVPMPWPLGTLARL